LYLNAELPGVPLVTVLAPVVVTVTVLGMFNETVEEVAGAEIVV